MKSFPNPPDSAYHLESCLRDPQATRRLGKLQRQTECALHLAGLILEFVAITVSNYGHNPLLGHRVAAVGSENKIDFAPPESFFLRACSCVALLVSAGIVAKSE